MCGLGLLVSALIDYGKVKIGDNNIELLELKDISEENINNYFNASDICLMTSLSEGSPQFIKEAMACNKPIVSTDVGDVKWMLGDIEGHFITSYDADDVASNIIRAFDFLSQYNGTEGRKRLKEIKVDIKSSIERNVQLYHSLLPPNN